MRPFIRYLKENTSKPLIGVEVGVKLGENAANILQNLDIELLMLVDPWVSYTNYSLEEKKVGYNKQEVMDSWKKEVYAKFSLEKRVTIFPHSSKFVASMILPKAQIDFVYIDAKHTYDSVLEDCKLWYPLIKTDGILCGHDWNNKESGDQIKKAINEFRVESKNNNLITIKCDWIIKK